MGSLVRAFLDLFEATEERMSDRPWVVRVVVMTPLYVVAVIGLSSPLWVLYLILIYGFGFTY
jgi:hypothetical protein